MLTEWTSEYQPCGGTDFEVYPSADVTSPDYCCEFWIAVEKKQNWEHETRPDELRACFDGILVAVIDLCTLISNGTIAAYNTRRLTDGQIPIFDS